MLLNAQGILGARDRTTRTVPVPEWGDDAEVLIGSMGALDRAALQDFVSSLGKKSAAEPPADETASCDSQPPDEAPREYSMTENVEVMVRWCALSILDPQTQQRAFTDADIKALGAKSMSPLQRIYEAALDLDLETKKARDAAEKNSVRTTGGSSGGD